MMYCADGVLCRRCARVFVTIGILRWKNHFDKVIFAEANGKALGAEEILSGFQDETHRQIYRQIL